jgi:hypothetical protein
LGGLGWGRWDGWMEGCVGMIWGDWKVEWKVIDGVAA